MISAGKVVSGVTDACVGTAKTVKDAQKSHGKKKGTSAEECVFKKTDKGVFLTNPRCKEKILRDIDTFAKSLRRTRFHKPTLTLKDMRKGIEMMERIVYAREVYHAIVDIAKKATDSLEKSLKAFLF